jgi:hypothetical protein
MRKEEIQMRSVASAIFVASSLVVGLAAQGQQPPTTTPAQPSAQAGKVTISGCIQAAAPEAAAPGAPAAAPASSSKFDLASAKVVTAGPVGTTGTAPTATRYRLEGEEKVISPHMNHQVEISGTVTPATGGGVGAAAASPMLKVDSVKMVAAKCTTN